MKRVLTVLLILAVGATAFAQLSDDAKLRELTQANSLGVKPVANPASLLDLSRMHWSNSYSISFFSGNGYSGSVGMLQSMMIYDLSSQFTLGLSLGIAHDIGASWQNGNREASIFPGFWLDFHPSENFNMNISVQRIPGNYSPNGYRSYGWPRYWNTY